MSITVSHLLVNPVLIIPSMYVRKGPPKKNQTRKKREGEKMEEGTGERKRQEIKVRI